MDESGATESIGSIAIVGLCGRFPGAKNLDVFWRNLRDGIESITFFSDEELAESGIPPEVYRSPNYVKAVAVLEDIDQFAASFFGFSPREAEATDPQHRIFLECAWEALEAAGYDPVKYDGLIGVYAGVGVNNYALDNMRSQAVDVRHLIGNDKDFLTTRVSYKLNLKGPSIVVQTACSTSLVAVQLACHSLLEYQCDMALAGGVSILFTEKSGYLYQEGGILSPDGHCRAFDARAQGTLAGDGVGLVVLKRLEDALVDGDTIHAVIKGAAVNNDGALKVGYTAPSVKGQMAAIAMAQSVAGVDPETITYVETHGTGTALGDPTEITALTEVFQASTLKRNFCAIGSLKTNIGHLNTAAGVASLIKTVLMLKNREIVPSLHFERPNPEIDFDNSPFYVNTALSAWRDTGSPRRAGVSSFGIGGTNAHLVLEEAPRVPTEQTARPWQLLILSAQTDTALELATRNLAEHLVKLGERSTETEESNLADVAYTLQVGRRAFHHRRVAVCRDVEDASTTLRTLEADRVFTATQESTQPRVVFMFPGQGAQHVGMGRELYQCEPLFREQIDLCSELLRPHLKRDLRHVLYPDENNVDVATRELLQTAIAQPAIFVTEYALAQVWMAWGVQPVAMIGHSVGEYVAACLAGVLSLKDALALLAARGHLLQELPKGSMISVQLSEQAIRPFMSDQLSLAAINGPSRCVVSGSPPAVDTLTKKLDSSGISWRRLHTSHAFHSKMVDPIMEPFTEYVKTIHLGEPQIPYLSNVTGTWITSEEVGDVTYWARHMRQTVHFARGLELLVKEPDQLLLEVGPGRTLSTLAAQHPHRATEQLVQSSLSHPQEGLSDVRSLLNACGRLWLAGVEVDWFAFHRHEQRRRVPLPTYPFERERYWARSRQPETSVSNEILSSEAQPRKKPDIADWFYIPSWKRSVASVLQPGETLAQSIWLLFVDQIGLGHQLAHRLEQQGQEVILVTPGEEYAEQNEHAYTLNPRSRNDYDTLFARLLHLGKQPETLVHLWSVTATGHNDSSLAQVETAQDLGFYSLMFIAQALGAQGFRDEMQIAVVSSNLHEVNGDETICPWKATLLGPVNTIPQEYTNLHCCSIDLVVPNSGDTQEQRLLDQLLMELTTRHSDRVVAYRGNYRWVQSFEPVRLDGTLEGTPRLFSFQPVRQDGTLETLPRLRPKGVYLITGGFGGLGFVLAKHLARSVHARLILTGRSELPERDYWENWLATHDANDKLSRMIRQIQELEGLGSEVLAFGADVVDQEQMQAIIARATAQFGQIHGVIHAAGVPGGGVIQQKSHEQAGDVLAPKVKGALVLDAIFERTPLDFFVLISSITSVLGTFGQVDYAAANAFLDAFAYYRRAKEGTFTVCINWDAWQEVGMATQMAIRPELQEWWAAYLQRAGISPGEGVDAFSCVLGSTLPQVLVSPHDFLAQVARTKQSETSLLLEMSQKAAPAKTIHTRSDLSTAYTAPRNEHEQKLVEVWQDVLGVDQIGVHDNFFELGGDSLLSIQLSTRLQTVFQANLSIQDIFQCPTIAQMAERIQLAGQVGQSDVEEIEKQLAMVEQLSDDEVRRLLALMKSPTK